jgi:pyruvate dehydrogenase E2 component (dihydrolipoamide acetyltransferase)
MGTRIILPSGGQTTDESLVTYWYKKVGDAVRLGEPLFSVETDKATLDIESCAEGVLLAIYHEVDETVSTGSLMAYVGQAGEALPDDGTPLKAAAAPASAAPAQADAPPETAVQTQTPAAQPDAPAAANEEPNSVPAAATESAGPVLASPAARKLARDSGIALESIPGSQPLKRKDVAALLETRTAPAQDGFTWLDMSASRRTIAQRMTQSLAAAPQFQVSIDVDMESAIALRAELNKHLADEGCRDYKVSYNDILMKCACAAMQKHPKINSSIEDGRIKLWNAVHFGLAVGLDDGLLVPVVHNADTKTIGEIAQENANNILRARKSALRQEDMTGGTITLTNLGMFGVTHFTAILNPPESCILAVGSIEEKPVVRRGAITIGHVMSITATFDHRIIDGAYGAAFLKDLKNLLENTGLLLL